MAYGLAVEGSEGPFLGQDLTVVVTCEITGRVADARRALAAADDDSVVVVAGGLAVGEVNAKALARHSDHRPLLEVIHPVPSTVRPSVTVASLAGAGGGRQLVTTSAGRLLGRAIVDPLGDQVAEEPEGDDEVARELHGVMAAIGERFGDREPSEEELRALLHEMLVKEGRSPEEADRFLAEMDAPGDAGMKP